MKEKLNDSSRSLKSDLERVDAHAIQLDEYEEIPELTDEAVERGRHFIAGTELPSKLGKEVFRKALQRGRPKAPVTKISTTIRLDTEVLEAFKATGRGWQTRLNKALRDWLQEHPLKRTSG